MSAAVIKYPRIVARWEPNARGRLEQAALELYVERGFDNTTVAEIAERAGLTERTFFRHFADKREVLFGGSADLLAAMVQTVAAAPKSAAPLDAVAAAFEAVTPIFEERGDVVRIRRSVIAATPELQERELIKLASWSSALAEALRGRGVREPAASLAAEAGVAVFRTAFERWVTDERRRDLTRYIREGLEQLKVIAGGG
ncbi:MAG TPA: TetR family transcriptional regulator [Acidimicrobiales bacterium]|nr:TetR family transcriptional regulator [Acidimicrobiales bacterium]